jgi:hypothetical protein
MFIPKGRAAPPSNECSLIAIAVIRIQNYVSKWHPYVRCVVSKSYVILHGLNPEIQGLEDDTYFLFLLTLIEVSFET